MRCSVKLDTSGQFLNSIKSWWMWSNGMMKIKQWDNIDPNYSIYTAVQVFLWVVFTKTTTRPSMTKKLGQNSIQTTTVYSTTGSRVNKNTIYDQRYILTSTSRPSMRLLFIREIALWASSGFPNRTKPQPADLPFSILISANLTSATALNFSFRSCHFKEYGRFLTHTVQLSGRVDRSLSLSLPLLLPPRSE